MANAACTTMRIHDRVGIVARRRRGRFSIAPSRRSKAAPARPRAPGTAALHVHGFRFLSSVLPWRSCGTPWVGATLAEKMTGTLDALRYHIDQSTVWGGDWNQALEGPEHAGSSNGRNRIIELSGAARLSVPTRSLGSASPGHRSIDHIAVPIGWDVLGAHRVPAEAQGRRVSDHDAYVISVDR